MLWEDEHISIMSAMLTDNKTAGKIAASLSQITGKAISRNAVIGKIHRVPALREIAAARHRPQGKAGRPLGEKGMGWVRKKRAVPKIVEESVAPQRLPTSRDEFPNVGRPLMLLKHGQCRWAVNDAEKGGLHLFCGMPTGGDDVYCPVHRAIAHKPLPPIRRK